MLTYDYIPSRAQSEQLLLPMCNIESYELVCLWAYHGDWNGVNKHGTYSSTTTIEASMAPQLLKLW